MIYRLDFFLFGSLGLGLDFLAELIGVTHKGDPCNFYNFPF